MEPAVVQPEVIAIVGLTGTGKTELAIELARRTGAEIISADSMQVYRELDIGTAKPSIELRRHVRHHLIDVVDPPEQMTAGWFASLARQAAREILARGQRVILCGGTGLYARAFAGGLAPELASDTGLREELRQRPLEDLYAELRRVDAASAAEIPPSDRVRIERALEASLLCGRPASSLRAEHGFGDRPFLVRWFGLDLARDALWARIEERVDAMLTAGWLDELEALRTRYDPSCRSLQAIGYRELGSVLDGELDLAGARERIIVQTRRYAKRQRTWFRAEPGLCWLDAADPAAALARILGAGGA